VTNRVAGCEPLISLKWWHRGAPGIDLQSGALCRYRKSDK
jgi:hypothetical protein